MIEVREVKTRKEIKEFVNLPLDLYYKNKYFVPCLYSDEMKLFKKNPVYASCADTIFYNAYDDGKIVGRIQGIIQRDANKKWNRKRVRFTRFDSINDQEVANLLFDKVNDWAKEKGMTEIVGPLGFSDLDREGLLIEGFNYLSTFEEQYNYPYYQKLIENYGFEKEVDWVEEELRYPYDREDEVEKLKDLSERVFSRYNLHLGKFKSINQFLKKHHEELFNLIEECYSDLYGTTPITNEMRDSLIAGFKFLVKPRDLITIFNEKEELIAFGFGFASIAKAIQKSYGRLTPFAIIRILKSIRNPKIIELALIGFKKEYMNKGVPALIVYEMMMYLKKVGCEHLETNLNLEDNSNILNLFSRFDRQFHKRRRSFVKEIK